MKRFEPYEEPNWDRGQRWPATRSLGSPIKRHRVKAQRSFLAGVRPLLLISGINSLVASLTSVLEVSAFAAPVAHQDQGQCLAPVTFCDPEDLRYRTVSMVFNRISWLLTSPTSVHSTGSKETNTSLYWPERFPIGPRGLANPKPGSPFRPSPMRTVSPDRREPGPS